MITKTPMGVDFFDERYGGIFRGRGVLVCGKAGTGKTALALQFLSRGLRLQERCLMLSTQSAEDLAIRAEAMGIDAAGAIDAGDLMLLEYRNYVPGRDREDDLMLPPDGFDQLAGVIEQQAVTRVVLDTVLPWIALPTSEHLAEHVFSFVRAFQRMGITVLYTIPKPGSVSAVRLYRLVEDLVPVSLTLLSDQNGEKGTLIVNKHVGASKVGDEIPFITDSSGRLVPADGGAPSPTDVEQPAQSADWDDFSGPADNDSSIFDDETAAAERSQFESGGEPEHANEEEDQPKRSSFSSVVFGGN